MDTHRPFDPASRIQDYRVFGEFGDVNPSITDSSTYTFMSPDTMKEAFDHEMEGCFLYSRHFNPMNKYLCRALSSMEDTEAAQVTASGMSAISACLLQLCDAGDEIISSWTIYGGTYALMRNFLPRFGITTRFTSITDLDRIKSLITPKTKVIYCESISNPLLEVPNMPELANLAHAHGITLIVDNTFSPMILAPHRLGADIVIYSLTKFVNGTSDCVAGAICAPKEFIDRVTNVTSGACMLLGPVLDSLRSASILKNLHSLHLRMMQHSRNALFLSTHLQALGIKTFYPGLWSHPQHALMTSMMNPTYGYGGMMVIDVGTDKIADKLMAVMQEEQVGYLAVSLGYFKTLFSEPAHSTSSEIPEEDQKVMGLSDGMIRLSVGLDQNIEQTLERIKQSMLKVGILTELDLAHASRISEFPSAN